MARFSSVFDPAIVNRVLTSLISVTFFAVVLRYCFFDAKDPTKCGAVMNEGVWLDRQTPDTALPTQWQPPGCMMHTYQPAKPEASTCLAGRRLLFVGDSTIRTTFWAVAKKLDAAIDTTATDKHADIQVEKDGVKLEFIWDPYLNSTRLSTELYEFHPSTKTREDKKRPAVMLMGTGLWYARNEPVNGLKKWKDTLDEVVKHMRAGRTTTDMTYTDLQMLAPVPIPAYDKLNQERKDTITPDKINFMNQYLQQLSDLNGVDVIWAFNALTTGQPQVYESSGMHLQDSISAKEADILLNLRCNSELPVKYPYEPTCCIKYQAPNYQQWLGLIFALAIVPTMNFLRSREGAKPPSWFPSDKAVHGLLVFGLALVYCFYADRTQVFNKSHKHFTVSGFLLLVVLSLALGLATTTKSSTTQNDQPFLFRDQTDEWKGWMQFAILIYHYTGASKVAWVYGFIRITVAAYLFMTGYGHTIYFYKKKDYSFKRVAGVLIRLNLLSIALPYMMKTSYDFYYFAPLSSWWFLIVYATMRIGSAFNQNTRYLLAKIGVSAALSAFITNFPGILETVFTVLNTLCGTNWDLKEWRFRVALDMWIPYFGMLVALAFIKLSDNSSPLGASLPAYRKFYLPASAVALTGFFMFQTTRENKFIYNAYHPYISWIPIGAFIILRNATPTLRNSYSKAFAFIGKCSLETFTLQFHIWLAADTKGLLDFGLFGAYSRFANFLIATFVFIVTSHKVAGATGELTMWIMGPASAAAPRGPRPPPQSLPVSSKDVEEEREKDESALGSLEEKKSVAAAGWGQNLKVRVAGILVGLWVLNMTYTP